MSLPTISVIFLSYKQEAYVVAALRSVLSQDLPDYEVIIGDDASPDRTRALIEAEIASYRGKARIVMLPPQPNLGIIRNFNRCVARSTGEILVAAAGDDVSHPQRLRRVAEFFRDHPECYAHYSNARIVDAAGDILRPTWYHHAGVLHKEFDPASYHLYQGVQFCGATGSYRAAAHRRFPPIYGVYGGEDGPMILRSLMLGSAAVDSEILLDWRWHGGNVSHGGRPRGLGWKDKLRRCAAWSTGQKMHRRGYLSDIAFAEKSCLAPLAKTERLRLLAEDMHAQASLKFQCVHPAARWTTFLGTIRRFWIFSPRGTVWKARFVAKALVKKLIPGPIRGTLLFHFSKF